MHEYVLVFFGILKKCCMLYLLDITNRSYSTFMHDIQSLKKMTRKKITVVTFIRDKI